MVNTIKYKNPPLEEVVCDFRFELENPNDSILPGLLYSKIQDDYPKRKQRINPLVTSPGIEQEIIIQPISQFYNNEETQIIQVGIDLLSIHVIKDYPNWENYKPIILKILSIYKEIANPISIKRIGLRAINKVSISKEPYEITQLDDYFQFYPVSPFMGNPPMNAFFVQVETPFNDDRDKLILRNGTIVAESENKSAFLLDIDYSTIKPKFVLFERVDEWLEEAHEKMKNAFESCITEKLREQFNK